MRSSRAILSLRYTPVDARGGIRQAAGALLRYIHYRDQHVEEPERGDVDRMLRYVSHRDRSSTKGRLFDRDHVIGDAERRRLGAYVVRSTKGLPPPRRTASKDTRRAIYQMVLSPEEAAGLDLRAVARAAMAQLESDAGKLPPWIAAEHRNTRHPHVHIVMAARREISPGRFRSVQITRPRLAAMKGAMALEIARQRGAERQHPLARRNHGQAEALRLRHSGQTPRTGWRTLRIRTGRSIGPVRHAGLLFRVQLAARRYQRQMERELEQQRRARDLELER